MQEALDEYFMTRKDAAANAQLNDCSVLNFSGWAMGALQVGHLTARRVEVTSHHVV